MANVVDGGWSKRTVCLDFRHVTESETGSNLAKWFKQSMDEWAATVKSVTSDGAANMLKANQIVAETMGDGTGVTTGYCCCHGLQLGAKTVLDRADVKGMLSRVVPIMRFWHQKSNVYRLNRLRALFPGVTDAVLKGHDCGRPPMWNATRWNGVYLSLIHISEPTRR